MTTGQVQRFGDGYSITCRKVGSNDTLWRDWLHESQRMVRTTRYWMLDERTRIAGCHMIRELVEEVIAEEGIEPLLEQFAYEVVEHGRRGLQARIRAMTHSRQVPAGRLRGHALQSRGCPRSVRLRQGGHDHACAVGDR